MTIAMGQCCKGSSFMTPGLHFAYNNHVPLHKHQMKHDCFDMERPYPSFRVLCWNKKKPKRNSSTTNRDPFPQNVDLPLILPKNKKKPYPVPIRDLQRLARADKRLAELGVEKPLEPPKNGILVPQLIPVAHEVLQSWKDLIRGLAQLLHVIPVYACSECSEVHVAETGHQIRDCRGPTNTKRRGQHSWIRGSMTDVLVPVECYHQFDPFGRRVKHETRFEYDRIPTVVEICIQAGVDIPGYPSRRRTKPIRVMGKRVIDRGGFLADPVQAGPSSLPVDLDPVGALSRVPPPDSLSDLTVVAQETLDSYEAVELGVRRLMKKYTVKACGYCPEVHVGPWGHNAKLCGAFKHQWRDGKHGWQDAIPEEVIPPNYVWHVKNPKGPPLKNGLKTFYGKAPAIVEVCMQAGATRVPKRHLPMMRLDIVLPEHDESGLVA